jgi:Zn-dependent protease/CBS domain-containing protein
MIGSGIGIGRLAGIPISVHPLWLVIVALITWSLGATYYPDEVSGIAPAAAYGLGLASALLLFASILLHELGHAIVARRYGIEIEGIELWLLGGVSKLRGEAHRPDEELRFALAGPAVTAVIAVVFGAVAVAIPSSWPKALVALVDYQAYVNSAILVFNLLPAFPLDGGRVVRSLLWRRTGSLERATTTAAEVGRGFGYVMIALAFVGAFLGAPGLLWLALIGIFLIFAGQAEESSVRLKSIFAGLGLRKVMAVPAVTADADLTVADAVRDLFAPLGFHSLPVVDGRRVVGLLTIELVESVPAEARETTRAKDVADRDPSLVVGEHVTIEELSGSPGFQHRKRAIVVCDDGQIGILSQTAIQRAVRARGLLADRERPRTGGGTPAGARG